jgi:hypothetical protein
MSSVSAVRMFDNDEAGYSAWLRANASGYVINTRRSRPASYMVLHTARCHTIDPLNGSRPGAFTERQYIKLCGTDYSELRRAFGRESGRCKKCQPLVNS